MRLVVHRGEELLVGVGESHLFLEELHGFDELLSILPQLGKKDEVIISDDHSTDNTLDIVKGDVYKRQV